MNSLRILLSFVIMLASSFAFCFSVDLNEMQKKMISDLEFVKNTFKTQYAPLEWKSTSAGWDLDDEIEKAKQQVENQSDISIKEYQEILKSFFKSVEDYHVEVIFYSTEFASLPFKIKSAEGRYFFTHIDRKKLSATFYPIKEGDELISFDGKPIAEAVREFKEREFGKGDNPATHALAEDCFPTRSGAEGHRVPKGPVMISVRPKGLSKIQSYQLIWNYTPETIKSNFLPHEKIAMHTNKLSRNLTSPKKSTLKQHFKKMMLVNRHFKVDEDPRRSVEEIGARRSYIPVLGKKIWESDQLCPFYAYIFEDEAQRRIGFLRIPHYLNFSNEMEHFQQLVLHLEENSEALIIDQINNPGGSLFYLYALASMLTDQPLYAPRHKMAITQKEVALALEIIPLLQSVHSDEEAVEVLGDVLEGNPANYQTAHFLLNYFRFIIDEWNRGHNFTYPTYLWGIDYINPHPEVRYTKPILLVVNSMDFSGGDFFPAIMQDNKRVTVFGSRTAGAGGFVLSAEYPNLFGIEMIRYTASVAERQNSNPIESHGVIPDILYELTADDLQNNYREYGIAIIKALNSILNVK